MRITLAQTELENTKKDNLNKMIWMIKNYCQNTDLIVFPEMSMGRASDGCTLLDMAEDLEGGEFSETLRKTAKECGVYVCACLWEKSGTEKVYNTAVVYSPGGEIVTKYRKLHLFDALSVRESDTMLKGDALPEIFEINGIKCCLAICYDLRFPEVFRHSVFKGAELIILPAAWYAGEKKAEHLNTLCSARALENTVFLACADLCGDDFTGRSAVYEPYGGCVAAAEDEETVLTVSIQKERIEEIRAKVPCVANFRRDILLIN